MKITRLGKLKKHKTIKISSTAGRAKEPQAKRNSSSRSAGNTKASRGTNLRGHATATWGACVTDELLTRRGWGMGGYLGLGGGRGPRKPRPSARSMCVSSYLPSYTCAPRPRRVGGRRTTFDLRGLHTTEPTPPGSHLWGPVTLHYLPP